MSQFVCKDGNTFFEKFALGQCLINGQSRSSQLFGRILLIWYNDGVLKEGVP